MEKKLYFISADIEGCSGTTVWEDGNRQKPEWLEAREQMTAEVAAACQAILDCGHDVVVRDGHGSARNIIHAKLPRGVRLMRGWANHPGSMVAGIDEKYAGLLFVGYHSPGGAGTNPLAHTMNHSLVTYVKINEKLASEFTINRYFAAQFGVPAIFLSGDKGMCDMAMEEIPDIQTVAVKDCRGGSTFNMHPQDACDAIYEGVKLSLNSDHAPQVNPEEFRMEVRVFNHQGARSGLWIPGVELIDSNTIKYTAKTPAEMNFVRAYVTK